MHSTYHLVLTGDATATNNITSPEHYHLGTTGNLILDWEVSEQENTEKEKKMAKAAEKLFSLADYKQFSFLPVDWHPRDIIVIGTGGTGGYVVRDLARFIHAKRDSLNLNLTLIDDDKVEARNIARQNFIEPDLGRYKAEVLAERYSAPYGIEINAIISRFDENTLPKSHNYPIIVGCVDNNAARREIFKYIRKSGMYTGSIWIDSGNEAAAGQVIMGATTSICTDYLPFVVEHYPEMLDVSKDPKEAESCAERAERDIQNIFVNLTAATHILNAINTIFSGKKTSIQGVEFSISGATKPVYLKKSADTSRNYGAQGIWRREYDLL